MRAVAKEGVVLAGGDGSRLGGNKASARLAGRSLLEHAVDRVRAAGLEPRACAREQSTVPAVDVVIWREPSPAPGQRAHPLAGIAYALARASGPIVVLPVDLPFLPSAVLSGLATHPAPLALLAVDGRPASLVLRAEPGHASALEQAASEGAPSMRTLLRLGAQLVELGDLAPDAPSSALFNVNDADDLARAERRFADG
jgi:molybdopterin-guanine dinucleotide biosynthesis protein A